MASPGFHLSGGATTEYQWSRPWWPAYLATGLFLVLGAIGGIVFGGAVGEFMLAGVQVLPFALLAYLAYMGVRHEWAKVLAIIWLALVLMGLGGAATLIVLAWIMQESGLLAVAPGATTDFSDVFTGGRVTLLLAVMFWIVAGWMVSAFMLTRVARRTASRVLPIDAGSSIHAIALSLVCGATIIAVGQLIATRGNPLALEMVDMMEERSALEQYMGILFPFIWMVPAAMVAVGFPVVRSGRRALERLGLMWPTGRQVLIGLGVAILMVVVAMVVDAAVGWLWSAMGWQRTDTEAFDRLMGAAISPIGAVLIGVTAGLGEEMIVRGALQPRLGILLSNLFFTGLHALQYGFDALLLVFVMGLILGVLRARTNTTTSSIAHGVYDFILVMLAAMGAAE